jgi:hypothetical protein
MNDTLQRILTYIMNRLREPSTYPQIMLMVTAVTHWAVADEASKQQIVMDICLFAAGLIGAILPDRMKSNTRTSDPSPDQPPKGTP